VPGLPTEFSSATVRAEAGESAEGVASRAGRRKLLVVEARRGGLVVGVGVGLGRRLRSLQPEQIARSKPDRVNLQ
jgi:hypothetical protein